jgi:hypothetical protein
MRPLGGYFPSRAAAHEGCSQGVLDEVGQGHPQCGRLCLRLHEKLIVDVNGSAHRLVPS